MYIVFEIGDIDGFDWDDGNREHATRYGVSEEQFEAAVKLGIQVFAAYERNGEVRYSAYATTPDGMPIEFAFTVRNGKLRPITVHKVKRTKRNQR